MRTFMSNCILTVSIAAYNVEKFLPFTLESLCINSNNTWLEVLIIDDGSSDKTSEIAKRYEEKYPNIFKLVKKQNGGWGSTINRSVAIANGKYFKQLDGDDEFETNNIIDFLNFLNLSDSDLVVSPYLCFRSKDRKVISEKTFYGGMKESRSLSIDDSINNFSLLEMHAACFKTSVLKLNSLDITENCFYTDVEYMVKAVSFCKSICYYDRVIYKYRVGLSGQSVSPIGMRKHYKEHEKVLKNLIQHVALIKLSAPVKKILMNRISLMCYDHYTYLLSLKCCNKSKVELVKYDNFIKEIPSIYNNCKSLTVRLMRKMNFYGIFIFRIWFIIRYKL